MVSRRHDWTAAEALEMCKSMEELKTKGHCAGDINRILMRQVGAAGEAAGARRRRLKSIKNVCRKGAAFWSEKQQKVQVGKHSKLKRGWGAE